MNKQSTTTDGVAVAAHPAQVVEPDTRLVMAAFVLGMLVSVLT